MQLRYDRALYAGHRTFRLQPIGLKPGYPGSNEEYGIMNSIRRAAQLEHMQDVLNPTRTRVGRQRRWPIRYGHLGNWPVLHLISRHHYHHHHHHAYWNLAKKRCMWPSQSLLLHIPLLHAYGIFILHFLGSPASFPFSQHILLLILLQLLLLLSSVLVLVG